MTALIFAAQGMSASGMKDSVEMIIGPQDNFHPTMLAQKAGIEYFRTSLTALVTKLKSENDEDILTLTNRLAVTSFNVGAQLSLLWQQVAIVSGTILPVVLTALEIAGVPLPLVLSQVIETGRNAGDALRETVTAEDDF